MVQDSNPSDLSRLAINAALDCQWQQALDLNNQINKLEPQNIECLNRIAKACFELGQYNLAKKHYLKVLDIDPYNIIAQKNLKKVNSIKSGKATHNINQMMAISPDLFLEEPGITTVVNLVKLAEPQKLLMLSPGMTVDIVTKKKGIVITDMGKAYLGAFPDDISHHLIRLIDGGNKYQVIIKSVKPNGLSVLVREIVRSKKFKNQASFLGEAKNWAYPSDNISLLKDLQNDSPPEDDSGEDTTN